MSIVDCYLGPNGVREQNESSSVTTICNMDPQVLSHVIQPLLVPVYRTGQISDNLTELQDICYHLLQLYCDHSHDLSQLINPATFTPCVLDYQLIWHLFHCLVPLQRFA
ncbi:nuclear pore complex protein Nup98-Nup96-like [Dysidea avara]|uniref:nuclear pore complex protein Nup98-Nup96-like n=1 Tax=Dysidea avara TaxID=196820 RepID=UPI00332B69D2